MKQNLKRIREVRRDFGKFGPKKSPQHPAIQKSGQKDRHKNAPCHGKVAKIEKNRICKTPCWHAFLTPFLTYRKTQFTVAGKVLFVQIWSKFGRKWQNWVGPPEALRSAPSSCRSELSCQNICLDIHVTRCAQSGLEVCF